MVAGPLLGRQGEGGPALFLVSVSAPCIEVVSANACWSEQHIFRAVPMRVTLHPGELEKRVKNAS